jgi:hypothetical protein
MAYNNCYVFNLTMMSCRLLSSYSPLKIIRNKAVRLGVALFTLTSPEAFPASPDGTCTNFRASSQTVLGWQYLGW